MSTEPEPKPGPKFTERLVMHMNGGSKFSVLEYAVLANGQETGIRHVKRTDGRPKYLITQDIFHRGDAVFDVMETKGVGLMAWLLAHYTPPAEGTTPPAEARAD